MDAWVSAPGRDNLHWRTGFCPEMCRIINIFEKNNVALMSLFNDKSVKKTSYKIDVLRVIKMVGNMHAMKTEKKLNVLNSPFKGGLKGKNCG